MPAPVRAKKKKPLGSPIVLPEADDPQVAAPDQRDQQRGMELAKVSALIFALLTIAGLWDRTKLQYKVNGHYISPQALRQEWEKVITEARARARTLAQSLINREVSIAEWQLTMRDDLKAIHTVMGALAQGGQSELSPAALQRIGQLIQPQFDYLNKRAAKIASGEQALNGTLISSAILYPAAARDTYFYSRLRQFEDRGYGVAERIRHANESCPGCVETEGFWPIDECPPIGSQDCMANDLCDIVEHVELPQGASFNTYYEDRPQAQRIVRKELMRRRAIQ